MRKVLVMALAFGAIASLNAACTGDDDDDDGHTAPNSITISGGTTVAVGSTLQLTATGNYDGGETDDLTASSTWTSSSNGVATVSATGLVTGVSAGTTTISAEHDEVVGQATVTVTSGGAATFNFNVGASNWPHTGGGACAGVRVLHGSTPVYCNVDNNPGASWAMTMPALLEAGEDYTVEVWGDTGTNATYQVTDHSWSFTITNASGNYNNVFDHNVTVQSAITWPVDTGCP